MQLPSQLMRMVQEGLGSRLQIVPGFGKFSGPLKSVILNEQSTGLGVVVVDGFVEVVIVVVVDSGACGVVDIVVVVSVLVVVVVELKVVSLVVV